MGRRDEKVLPDINGIGRYLADGMLLWLMTGIYFIPQIILLRLFGGGLVGNLLTVLTWFYETWIAGAETISFVALMADVGVGIAVALILPGIYYFLSWPFYRAAMTRYSVTGNKLRHPFRQHGPLRGAIARCPGRRRSERRQAYPYGAISRPAAPARGSRRD